MIGYLGTALVLLGYVHVARTGRPTLFHVANVIGAALLVPYDLAHGAGAAAVLSAAFGVIAIAGLGLDAWRTRSTN